VLFKKRGSNSERLNRVAKLYLGYKFFGALYFTYPIFYEFASRTMTPVQVGLFFSAVGVCGFIAEVPTGIIADKRSRKFSGLVGMGLLAIAPLIIFFGHTFTAYLVAALFYGLGAAFLHGALDALVYDHKGVSKQAYRRVNALEMSYGQAGILVSAVCGGWLFSVSSGLPFVIQAAMGVVCVVLIAYMREDNKKDHVKSTATHRRHLAQSMRHLFASPYLRVIVVMSVTFSVMLGMCIQFVHEAAMIERGLDATQRGLLISGAGVITIAVLNLILLKTLKSDILRIVYLGIGATAAYVVMSVGSMSLFLAGYLLWCCLNATSTFLRVMVHDRIPGTHRSTIMSGFKTLAVLVGLGASIGTGILVQWAHTPRAAYLLFGVIAGTVLLPCTIWVVGYLKKEERNVDTVPIT
jgi:MFS family permease